MQKYSEVKQFKITDEPIIKSNVIIIHATDNANVRQKCIYFPGYRDAKDTDIIKALQANKTVFFEGNFQPDRRTNQMQFIINKVSNANKEQAVTALESTQEALSMPNEELLPLEERTLPDKKYSFVHPKNKETVTFWSDGIYFWLEGEKHDKKKMNFKFIENYNSCVTLDKALLPDWYTVQVAQNLIKEQQDNSKMAALLDDFATY